MIYAVKEVAKRLKWRLRREDLELLLWFSGNKPALYPRGQARELWPRLSG